MTIFEQVYPSIEKIRAARADDEVVSVLKDVASWAGFDHFIISGLPHRGVSVEPFVLVNDWPDEWYERYVGRDYIEIDPVARYCFGTLEPFGWGEAPVDQDSGSPSQRLMNEATEFGLNDGVCVPIHTEDGMLGCVSFGGAKRDADPRVNMMLHLISLYAHGRLRLFRRRPLLAPEAHLTEREIEVLKWVATGKTSQDIADLLSITKRTVDFHMANAAKKLGTVTRAHTVAEAVSYRLIEL